ncbi:hypothetical protein QPK87_01570 [Kamptonema cortianum]|nr:hypothetical protein [Geitlerinema splendidum]MDK3155277.1 hypothetical protein [Kamptonema cortianum]
MPDVAAAWNEALPDIMSGVTGVGVWTALKSAVPIAYEDGVVVLGLPSEDSELMGHLKLPAARSAIERTMTRVLNGSVQLTVINGTSKEDWETEKIRALERRRLQEQALARQKAEIAGGRSWDQIYEQLSRAHAAQANRSMPQNRAKYFMQAVEIVSEALRETPVTDDLSERNFARCLERIAQYTELPSTLVALYVLEKTFEG